MRAAFRRLGRALLVAAAIQGCGLEPSAGIEARTPSVAPETHCPPVHIAVLGDVSGSRSKTLTPDLLAKDLEPLIQLIRACGGELRVGEVGASPPKALSALRLEPPPAPEPPALDAAGLGPFEELEEIEQQRARTHSYEAERSRWLASANQSVEAFTHEVHQRWQPTNLSTRSDVLAAVRRADLFLAEKDGESSGGPRYLLAVTDGQHTAGKGEPISLQSGAELIVVNGTGSLGVLANLNPLRFENLAAAIRYIETAVRPQQRTASR